MVLTVVSFTINAYSREMTKTKVIRFEENSVYISCMRNIQYTVDKYCLLLFNIFNFTFYIILYIQGVEKKTLWRS